MRICVKTYGVKKCVSHCASEVLQFIQASSHPVQASHSITAKSIVYFFTMKFLQFILNTTGSKTIAQASARGMEKIVGEEI